MENSLVYGLGRYPEVWDYHLKPLHTINAGIPGDNIQSVLWRSENLYLPNSVHTVVLLVGTNNMEADKPEDIANGVISSAAKLRGRHPQLHVIITGILPRDLNLSPLREKIRLTNVLLKSLCEKTPYATTFVEQSGSWTNDSGNLNKMMYFKDFIHLVEPG